MSVNNKIEIVKYTDEHFDQVELKEELAFKSLLIGDPQIRLNILAQSGNGLVILYDGEILGYMGYYVLWPGVCEIWAMPSIRVNKYPKTYLATVKECIDKTFKEKTEYHRFQVTCPDNAYYDKWIGFLGMTCEGILRQYDTERNDYKIWSRVKLCQQQ